MKTYRITIEAATDADSRVFQSETAITFDSQYTLSRDIVEWITQEVDIHAKVEENVCCAQSILTPGRHSTRCRDMCQACRNDNHEDCQDGTRISRVPYECTCAMRRHEEW